MEFEVVSKYKNFPIQLPTQATEKAAGYDFYVAKDIIVPPYNHHIVNMLDHMYRSNKMPKTDCPIVQHFLDNPMSLEQMELMTKSLHAKPTLVPTGIKCKLDDGKYLELSVRSSSPLKYWLMLANGVGIIDADYYNNPSNEGEIFFQMVNFSPVAIQLRAGDRIGQGIIKSYYTVDNQSPVTTQRTGGFGSTAN